MSTCPSIPPSRFQQHKRWLYTWTSSDDQYWNQIDYILCIQRWRSSIQSAKIRQGADCGSNHELLIAKFRLKLKKVGKTTRLLNQIPYNYIVEVTNRFKGLDLIDRVPEELWMEVRDIVQEGSDQKHPQEKEMQKGKIVVWGGLTNSWEKKRSGSKGEKEKYTHLNAEFQRLVRRDKKAFLSDQCKEIKENNRMGKIEISSRKLDTKGAFHAKMGHSKEQKQYGPKRSRRY